MIVNADCIEHLKTIEDNYFDSVVTDPPYHLTSIVKRFGPGQKGINNQDTKMGRNGPYHRAATGFAGQTWDGGDIAFTTDLWKEVYRTLSKKFKLGRVRILLKEPRSTLSWHRDPEPRLHIPIITNPGCRMVIEDESYHMPADGSIYITDNTKYHNFFNGGEIDRLHLVSTLLK